MDLCLNKNKKLNNNKKMERKKEMKKKNGKMEKFNLVICLTLIITLITLNISFANEITSKRTTAKQVSINHQLAMNNSKEHLSNSSESRNYQPSWYENHNHDDWITNVTFNTVNNSTNWEGPPHYYGDYTNLSTCVVKDLIYTLSVSVFVQGNFTQHVRAWIDWNQNEEFEESESYYLGSGLITTLATDIAVPNDALAGETRIRIIEQSSSDPGASGSCNGQGNHTGTYGETEDYTIFVSNSSNLGFVTGLVTDTSLNPIGGALVEIGSCSSTSAPDGVYSISLNPLTYSGTASAQYHNSITIDNITVVEEETTTVDFMLPTPEIDVDTSPIILQLNPGDVVNIQRNVSNVGDGLLEFNLTYDIGQGFSPSSQNMETVDLDMEIGNLDRKVGRNRDELISTLDDIAPTSQSDITAGNRNFGDLIPFSFVPRNETDDTQCVGVEFDGEFFWVAGNFMPTNHHLYKFDISGNLVATYIQPNFDSWGWRDLAWDGEFLYASYCSEVDVINPNNGQVISSFTGPLDINRALAYDPETGHFWTANFDSNIYEFDQNGIINTYPNTQGLSIYGMAWDDVSEGGPFLWLSSQDGPTNLLVSQFDPIAGQLTGVSFNGVETGGAMESAAGCCFTTEFPTDPGISVLFVLHQNGFDDIVEGYEIAPFSWWLNIDPMSDVLEPNENVDLDITIDLSGEDIVPGSTYETSIFVENNTPDTPEIPVVIDVSGSNTDNPPELQTHSLADNFPNPFNSSTSIAYTIPRNSNVNISIFNIKGQKVRTLVNDRMQEKGNHKTVWNGKDRSNNPVSSGIYYYKLNINGQTKAIKKCLMLK